MNGFCTVRLNWARDKLGFEMKFGMSYAPDAGYPHVHINYVTVTNQHAWERLKTD